MRFTQTRMPRQLGQARRLAGDIVFLSGGRLVEHSAAEHFFDRPDTREARDYLEGRLILA